MFILTLFVATQSYKLSRCPSLGKWLNKLWYILYIAQYFIILFSITKEQIIDAYTNLDKFQWNYTDWRKPKKSYILYVLIYLVFFLVVTLSWGGGEAEGKQVIWGILMVMINLCILTMSISIIWLWHCTIIKKIVLGVKTG